MPAKKSHARQAILARVSEDAAAILAALQEYFAKRAGLPGTLSQSDTMEIVLREAAEKANLKIRGKR